MCDQVADQALRPLVLTFDAFRKNRNVSNYGVGGGISGREVAEMTALAESLYQGVEQWIRANPPALL
jgi:hypothetical protein